MLLHTPPAPWLSPAVSIAVLLSSQLTHIPFPSLHSVLVEACHFPSLLLCSSLSHHLSLVLVLRSRCILAPLPCSVFLFVAPLASGGWIRLLVPPGPFGTLGSADLPLPAPDLGWASTKKEKERACEGHRPPHYALSAQSQLSFPRSSHHHCCSRSASPYGSGRNPPASSKDLWPFSHHSSQCFTLGTYMQACIPSEWPPYRF